MNDLAGESSASDWTPQETLALVAPIFGLSLEEATDCIIIVTDKAATMNMDVTIEGSRHPGSTRERACGLLYIHSLLTQALVRVQGELHEEVHAP